MGLQDRDYIRERAKLREAESKKSEPKKNYWPEENTKTTSLQKTTLIIIGIIIAGILFNKIKLTMWTDFLENGSKEDMQKMKNLQQHMEQEIKKNLLITIPQNSKPSLKSEQTLPTNGLEYLKNLTINRLIKPQEAKSWICIHPHTEKEKCKVLD
jgi:hypothetical protein